MVIKPKQDQSSEVTRADVRNKLDPALFAVKLALFKENGEGSIRCENMECAQKLANAASKVLSEKYEISILKPLKPRVKITGLSDDVTGDEIVDNLKKQNNLPCSAEIKVIRIQKRESRNYNSAVALLEIDPRTFDCLMKLQRVCVGWNRCWITEDVNVNRCYNCSTYGHKAATCNNTCCCPKCAGDHKANECENNYLKCVNCDQANKLRKSSYDELHDVNHAAWSINCPIYRTRANNARQRIDYSI